MKIEKAARWTIGIVLVAMFLGPYIVAACIVIAVAKSLHDTK